MSFSTRLNTLIGEVIRELDLSTPQKPLSDELHRFIYALQRKAKEQVVEPQPGGEDIRLDR